MSNFGKDLRMERIARGIALEEISSVTKISQRHLLALEQERFRLLPGGILNKGIVRGYAGAIGLDENDWTERFLNAYRASGQMADDDKGWTTFAANVGKARMIRRDAMEMRIRWFGAILLLLAVAVAAGFALRYYGIRAGWWNTALPVQQAHSALDAALTHLEALLVRAEDSARSLYHAAFNR
jgi:cytoskeletal protein RodZ